MEKMIAYCGLICSECPAYIATQKDSDEERKKVAEKWSKEFKSEIKLEDINCDGCLIEKGRLIGYCHQCKIRKCAKEKNLKNCAYCDNYACEELNKFFGFAPDAKNNLDEIKQSL